MVALSVLFAGLIGGCTADPAQPSNPPHFTSPGPPEPTVPVPDFSNVPGSTDRTCVPVPTNAPLVRSGDFIAGDFVEYRRMWKPNLSPDLGKLYWVPAQPQPSVLLTIMATSSTGKTVSYQAGSLTVNDGGRSFYPSGIPLPTAGHWKLVAQAGDSWGCFELDLP